MTQKDRIRSEEEPFSRGVDAKRRDVLCTSLTLGPKVPSDGTPSQSSRISRKRPDGSFSEALKLPSP